jgi:hypothetical protein
MGLVRGVARTAVIAGTATAVSNRVSRRQAGRWAAQDQGADQQQQQPVNAQVTPAQEPKPDKIAQLKELGQLRDQGVLTQSEFDVEKGKILAS